MGLDMYLYISTTFSSKYGKPGEDEKVKSIAQMLSVEDFLNEDELRFADVKFQVAYWRKANAIHKYFVDKCADGKDDCQDIYVELDDLKRLKELCEQVLENKSLARELLPSQSGFFFGSTEYDEYYYQDLENTIEQISKVIDRAEDNPWDIYYKASW
jgi:hypothetical protein